MASSETRDMRVVLRLWSRLQQSFGRRAQLADVAVKRSLNPHPCHDRLRPAYATTITTYTCAPLQLRLTPASVSSLSQVNTTTSPMLGQGRV